MKKFLAIVMCLAMALSMMTVVSFAADITIGAKSEVTVAPGEVVSIPVYINCDTSISFVISQIDMYVPAEITTFEAVAGTYAAAEIAVAGNKVTMYNDTGKTFDLASPICTLKVTAPETAGKYTITFKDDELAFADADMNIYAATGNPIVINVEAAEVKPEATIINTPTEAPNGGVVKVLQFANAAEFGIKYTGSNAEWAGQEFPSLATEGTVAAVEVVGLDDSFVAYAK